MDVEAGLNDVGATAELDLDDEQQQARLLHAEMKAKIAQLPEFEGKLVLEEVMSRLSSARTARACELINHRLTALRLQRVAGGTETDLERQLRSTYLVALRLAQITPTLGSDASSS
jgi:hypothetical protein